MNQIEIFVPTTSDVSNACDTSAWLDAAKKLVSNLFGGFTVYETSGGYVAHNGDLIEEKIFVVTSFTSAKKAKRYHGIVRGFCRNMARELGQESVMLRNIPVNAVEFVTVD